MAREREREKERRRLLDRKKLELSDDCLDVLFHGFPIFLKEIA